MSNDELNNFIDGLYDLKLVKFGEFVLGSGLVSPVYFDLRSIISSTKLLKQASKLFANYIQENKINYDVLCGVPFGASSLATAISLEVDKPSVFKRKVAKDYGGKKMVEGIYQTNDKVLLIEDVVVYATGLIEAAEGLRENDLQVLDVITLLDRQQGGLENCQSHGIKFHSIIKAEYLLQYLFSKGKINKNTQKQTMEFLRKNTFQNSYES